jgi:hypothetical protein
MHIHIPLSYRDLDAIVAVVPWRLLTDRGQEVLFATHGGRPTPQWEPELPRATSFGRFGGEPRPVRA